jgi:uncharacterized RDD family membrane protein YckC
MANWGYRVGGFLVDAGLVALVGFGLGSLVDAAGATTDTAETVAVLAIIGAWILDTTVIVGITRGRSVGKLLAATRIVRESGRPARFGTGFLRDTVCRILFLIPLVFLVDSLLPLGEQRQSLRDKIVSTRVLREPAYRSRRWVLTAAAVVVTFAWIAVSAASGMWETQNDYEALDRDVFISGCSSEGGSESGCACIFDYIRERVPYEDYARADRTEDTDAWPANVRRAMADGITRCDI